jgi:hypothetical protein
MLNSVKSERSKNPQSMSTESFPNFSPAARRRWESIPPDARERLLYNVWCGACRHEVTITNFSGKLKEGDLLLTGQCAECKGEVARLVEAS